MSKRNQIEAALLELDGGRFQQLGDAYLRKLGHQGVNWLGRSLGTDKVAKGTPDTWIAQPDGTFIFAEYSSISRSKVAGKLHEDLDKCLDEGKTGVPVSRIQQIFLVHTSVLSPGDELSLLEKAEAHGVPLSTIGIGPITLDLVEKYPTLALEYLGIEVDTGQILSDDDFIESYGMNELATPLDTVFQGRSTEVEEVLQRLESTNLLVVSGRAGVGKTRFVLECFRRFAERHPGWTIRGILNRNRDLFNDLRAHLTPPGKYLVLVDDANRVSTGFEYVLQRLHERKSGIELKVIATVRDYAREKVRNAMQPYGGGEIELQPLSEEEITGMLRTQYGILNPRFLDRIVEIAKGNPRLAVMAARVAVAENALESIQDATSIYERYYASVEEELDGALGDQTLLRVAGIISLLRVVDKCHAEQMNEISTRFGIGAEAFWEAAQRLHELEFVDMYEDEVVRISDQVLATYLFYRAAFVRRGLLDLAVLIEEFFPRIRHRVMDAIHGALNAFNAEIIIGQLRPHIQKAMTYAEESGDENKLLHLVDAFWFADPTLALLAIQQRLEVMSSEPHRQPLDTDPQKAKGSIEEGTLLHALGRYRYAGAWRRIALGLLLDYAGKKPSDLPHVIRYLVERYGFRHTSALEGYQAERDVIDILVDRTRTDPTELFVRTFCAVAERFLRTRFNVSDWKDEGMRLYEVKLTDHADISELRTKIWNHLITLARAPHRELVLGVLQSYASRGYDLTVSEVVAKDAAHILPFIESDLDPSRFTDCVLANHYLHLLDRHGVSYSAQLRARFESEEYTISELLDPGWDKRSKVGYEEYSEWWNTRVAAHFATATLEDYTRFFAQAETIVAAAANEGKQLELRFAVEGVLAELSTRNPSLFAEVLERHLASGNPLAFGRQRLPAALIGHLGSTRAWEILNTHAYAHRRLWLFDYFQVLPSHDITNERLEQLLDLFRQGEPREYPFDWRFLERYLDTDTRLFIRVAEILVNKANIHQGVGRAFYSLFNSYRDSVEKLVSLMRGREELIEQAYLLAQLDQPHLDHSGAIFDLLLTLNPQFGFSYCNWIFSHHVSSRPYPTGPDPDHDHRRYEFLWRRDDYASIMTGIIQRVFELERSHSTWRSYISVFFAIYAEDKEDEGSRSSIVLGRQEEVLASLIAQNAKDVEFVEWLFDVIATFSPERRVRLLAVFLVNNQDFKDFNRLTLDEKLWSASGSFVPVYQKRVEVLESFLPLVTSSAFLRHRKRIEEEIDEYRQMIESEKRRNFMWD